MAYEQISVLNVERIYTQAAAQKEAAHGPAASISAVVPEPAEKEAVQGVKNVEKEPELQPTEDDLLALGLGEFSLTNKGKGKKREDDEEPSGGGDLGLLD
jgi:hypothetical protein